MSFRAGCGFRIVGHVVRRWVNPAGTFATLVLAVPGENGERKIDLRAFRETVQAVADLGAGMTVEALGTVEVEALKNKAKEDVKVDGYVCWVAKLTVRTINVEGSSVKPAAAATGAKPMSVDEQSKHDGVDW
jgi:hypothetical protein